MQLIEVVLNRDFMVVGRSLYIHCYPLPTTRVSLGWGRDTLEAGKTAGIGRSLVRQILSAAQNDLATLLRRWMWLQYYCKYLCLAVDVFFRNLQSTPFLPESVDFYMYFWCTEIGDSLPLVRLYDDVIPVHWIIVWKAHYTLMIMGEFDWFPHRRLLHGMLGTSPIHLASICLMPCALRFLYIKIAAGRI